MTKLMSMGITAPVSLPASVSPVALLPEVTDKQVSIRWFLESEVHGHQQVLHRDFIIKQAKIFSLTPSHYKLMQLHVVVFWFAVARGFSIPLFQLLNEVLSLLTVTHGEINMGVTLLKFRLLYKQTKCTNLTFEYPLYVITST